MTDLPEIIRYLAVGAFVTVCDLLIYNFLTGAPRRLPRIPANVLSVTCGMVLGFTLHFALVFQPREPLFAERMIKYICVVGFSVYGVQNLVIFTLAELWRAPVHFVQAAAFKMLKSAAGVAQIFNLLPAVPKRGEGWYRRIAFCPLADSLKPEENSDALPISNRPVRRSLGAGGRYGRLRICATISSDFIDRMTGKTVAAVAGVIWNFIFFKFFVYA